MNLTGQPGIATAVNGRLPAPLLRWREGDTITLRVSNRLSAPTSIHWHGMIVPADMDGVPGLSFDGIGPGETYVYRFKVNQSGTYWYHSHSRFQEQTGLYGPIVIEPRRGERHRADREHVVLLSEWTDLDPEHIYRTLKRQSNYFNFQSTHGRRFRQRCAQARLEADDRRSAHVGTDAHGPDRPRGCVRVRLHLPRERHDAGRQLDGTLPARREGPVALYQRIVDDASSISAFRG